MSVLPRSIQNLISEFAKLPGIGPKSAQRLAFYLLKQPQLDLDIFAQALNEVKNDVLYCDTCHNMADSNPCKICSDKSRNHNLICVVEDPLDVVAMAQIPSFRGVYHVLGGAISPLDGIGPDKLKIQELLSRLSSDQTEKEIVLATNPSLEGEATAMYIAKQLKQLNLNYVKITRIGRGLPMGADLEYADELTLSKSLEGRQEI